MQIGQSHTGKPRAVAVDERGRIVSSEPTRSYAITKSDDTDLSETVTRGVTCGGAGNLVFKLVNDTGATTLPVVAGQTVRGHFARVMAATSVTTVVGWGD